MMSSTTDTAADQLVIAAARKEIVFIEDNVPDITTLIGAMGAGKEVIILDATRDGLRQIADALAGRAGIDALHIVSHGAAGSVGLGTLLLDSAALGTHAEALRTIGASLAAGGDILLYGCDIGAGSTGQAFVDGLAIATGADVAASSDLTGSAALGGDWDLEISSGGIETTAAGDASLSQLYRDTLGITGVTVDFERTDRFQNIGGYGGGANDVIYRVNDSSAYQLKIDGTQRNVALVNGAGFISSDTGGAGETMVTFSFAGGQVFSPTSIGVTSYQYANQQLVFKGYDSANNLVGTKTGTADFGMGHYNTISLAGLENIATLKLVANPASNMGKLFYLAFDNFALTNIQPAGPGVSSVSSSNANGAYRAGDTISVTVNFDRAVDVAGGVPTLQLETGSTDRFAVYRSGSGTSTLTFEYTVQAGDTSFDLDYTSTTALALNGATIKSHADGVDALLTLPTPGGIGSLGANKAIAIDTTAPAAPSLPTLSPGSDGGTVGDNLTNRDKPTITGTAETGATIRLYDGATEIGSVTATGGAWSITPTASLAQGAHGLTARATDAAGNVSAASQTLNLTIDTTPPTLSIASSTPALRSGQSATITFSFSEDPGASFSSGSVTVSGGSLGTVSGSGATRTAIFTPTSNFQGSASITVAAGAYQDIAGNNGGAANTPSIVIDTLAPAAPAVPDLAAASDSGDPDIANANTDNVTNVAMPTFGGAAGSAEAGAMIRVYDGAALIATTTALGNGSWSVDSSVALAEGQHTITAIATDAAGNASAASGALTLTIDLTPPGVPAVPDLAATSDSGASAVDNLTNAATPTFGGAAGSVEGGAIVKLYDTDGSVIASTVANGDGSWSVASTALADGAHAISARAIDVAGNVGAASSALMVTIDRTPPAAQALNAVFSADTGSSSTDLVTRAAAQTIAGTLSAALAAGERVEVSLDNGYSWTTAVADGTAWSLDGVTLAGSNTLQVRVSDAAGNAGTSYTKAYVLDTSAPAAPSTPDLDAASDTGSADHDDITGDTTPIFSGSAEAGATVYLYDGATLIGSGVATGGAWRIESTTLAAGSHDITARAFDLAGNTSAASQALTIQVITDAPTTKATALQFSADSGALANDLVTRVAAQTLFGTLDAALASGERVEVSIGGGAWLAATASVGSRTWGLPATLAAGTHPVAVRVTNAVGNSGEAFTRDYTLDTVAPTVTITSDVPSLKAGQSAAITFTFSEDPGATFSWDGSAGDIVVSGGALSALSGSGLVRTAVFTPAADTNAGTASISVAGASYVDLAGNGGASGSLAFSYDTLAPAAPSAPVLATGSDTGVLATDRITANNRPTFTGSAESGTTVTLVDGAGNAIGSGVAVDGAWAIVPTAALANGAHAVSARATDSAGNVGTASAALVVHIDTVAPALSITSNVAQLKIGDSATVTFTFSEDPGATFTRADITVDGGTLGVLSGSGLTRSAVFTPAAGIDGGVATITVTAGSYTDAAGNAGGAGTTPLLRFDTLAPAAPSIPDLDAASDTGASDSDNLTTDTTPTFSGTAPSGVTVRLYDGATEIGSALATGGTWSITSSVLGMGAHSITAVAVDAAGNRSAASQAIALTIEAPPAPPSPPSPPLVDGMPVQTGPVTLPGGVNGTSVSVPIVTGGRAETDGAAGLADIPLATGNGATQLLAQLPAGYGLSGIGASVGPAAGLEFLIASIKSATPGHAAGDQGHLVANGASYLAGLQYGSLLVQTVKPVSTADATGALVLRGFDPSGSQQTALVIDTAGLANGARLELVDIDFAAVVGKGAVLARGDGAVLTGDGASLHFTVAAGGSSQVFSGGGADLLTFGLPAAPSSANGRTSARLMSGEGSTMLHGGQDADTAAFAGVRADFDVVSHNGYVVVSSKATPQSKALVVNVEQLQFSDGIVAVENGKQLATLAGMYQSVLGRQADLGGFEFWADRHDDGVSWGAIALTMIGSNERLSGNAGFDGDAAHDIALLYQALFKRAADADGMAFWLRAMNGGMGLEQVAGHFVESAEMVGHQRAATDWDFFV
ncbi:Ig-like domain-containing protein [Massilia sp. G4R7]|uniref:Ig-like domain-containing protein n=1 Tax=Massilia phyllostachyos TaxID=2898585 RepID=A0ABS8PZJ1_9BURK|nr:Ig-like domain-containing protein [Massilia phyllostachyos]MCD2514913.1 Ig-like domain-containing protein [Massilia phyllostachyos]